MESGSQKSKFGRKTGICEAKTEKMEQKGILHKKILHLAHDKAEDF